MLRPSIVMIIMHQWYELQWSRRSKSLLRLKWNIWANYRPIFPLLEILFDKLASRQIADRGGGEIWFYKKSGNMDVVNQANTIASDECPSVARWPASEEGGDCCSLPATHQIDRRACPNISGTSWGLSIHYLRAIEDVPLQLERRFAPPFWERLDRPHCM